MNSIIPSDMKPIVTLFIFLFFVTDAIAQDSFITIEQQKIAVQTPGLFDRSDCFSVDFSIYKKGEYHFPISDGKAIVTSDNAMVITAEKGDAVKAMFDGVVRMSYNHPQYGNVIILRHDNGLETAYMHNRENRVEVGQVVRSGQTIAIVGGTQELTSCEFLIMVNGGRINPSLFIDPKSHRLLQQKVLFRKNGFRVEISILEKDPQIEQEHKAEEARALQSIDPFSDSSKLVIDLSKIGRDEWCYPLPGAKVISPFGKRGKRGHSGIDLKTKPNDPIYAVFDGVVTLSQSYYGYGNCIVLRHANGLETLYSHNSKNFVKVGDFVKVGQKIALTGRTGRATTEHLHFEIRVNGRHYNPNLLFDHTTKQLQSHRLVFTKGGGVTKK